MDSLEAEIREPVEILWRFHARSDDIETLDAIVCLGSYDLRVADRAADLALAMPHATVVVTGASGNWTCGLFDASEAEVFGRVLVRRGVPEAQILLETKATNIGENIAFSRHLLRDRKLVAFVTKPQTQMRVRATVPVHWPHIVASITAPLLSIEDYRSSEGGLAPLINEMVGDLQRMLVYPKLGFQMPVDLPEDVIAAYELLKSCGFSKHLMSAA